MAYGIKVDLETLTDQIVSLQACSDTLSDAVAKSRKGIDSVCEEVGVNPFFKNLFLQATDKIIKEMNDQCEVFKKALEVFSSEDKTAAKDVDSLFDYKRLADTLLMSSYVGKPQYADKCTYISTAMLMERFDRLNGNATNVEWNQVKTAMGGDWYGKSIKVYGNTYNLEKTGKARVAEIGNGSYTQGMIQLLNDNPEGVVVYCRYHGSKKNGYHAIVISSYDYVNPDDPSTVRFYALDPSSIANGANNGREIPLTETWLYNGNGSKGHHEYQSAEDLFSNIVSLMVLN